MLLAGCMSDVDVTPWLLTGLMHQLHRVIHAATLLVPKDLYLPAPPVYCPQPSYDSQVCQTFIIVIPKAGQCLQKIIF